MEWPRPVPLVGDVSSAAERAAQPNGWAFGDPEREAFYRVLASRRDIRRFRPDPLDERVLERVLAAAHAAPSVGHCQPWRFVLVADPATRQRAALLSDAARLAQARSMEEGAARHLLDLDLEGIREAPLGIVVLCDRRAPPAGVLGRATFADADLWSCACAIENLWLAARAEGLGVGWVTLFRPEDLAELVGAPDGVVPLGWLCIGWPDERPPAPGLERRGWSRRLPLEEVVLWERWPAGQAGPDPPPSHLAPAQSAPPSAGAGVARLPAPTRLAPPAPEAVVAAHDTADRLLAPPGSLGVLDRALDRILALPAAARGGGTLLIAASDHPVARFGVSAFRPEVTRHVVEAAVAGLSVGAVAARSAGLAVVVVDAGVEGEPVPGALARRPRDPRGDLVHSDGLSLADVDALVQAGRDLGRAAGSEGLVALGEIGIANTTVAAALACALVGGDPADFVGLGASSDSSILSAKNEVLRKSLSRARARLGGRRGPSPREWMGALGGGEIALLSGATLGAAEAGAAVVLDGLATSVAALAAVQAEPAVSAHLVAGQRSRERAHKAVLDLLGLEPLLDLRFRAGEGAGAAFAAGLLKAGLQVRLTAARVSPSTGPAQPGSASWPGPRRPR